LGSVRLFSKRYEKAIFGKEIGLSLPGRLRRRLWSLLSRLNHSYDYQPRPGDNWREYTSVLEQVPIELCDRYGEEELIAFSGDEEGTRVPTDLKGFVMRAYPAQVFDVLELFYSELPQELRPDFQCKLNGILEDERSDWRMVDGQQFKVDSRFLEMHVVSRSYALLKTEGFEGAADELNQARNELAADSVKNAIHNACKSMESVLKAVLGTESGNASTLVRQFGEQGFHDGLPDAVARAFGEQVLMALPFMRNHLGGHGQGASVWDVPKAYGELAIHLAASFALFIVNRSIQASPEQRQTAAEPTESTDDDLPL
jgi:hypothetical protein